LGALLVPEVAAALLDPGRLPVLYSGSGIPKNQSLGPDLFCPRARDARGRFAKGHSGNPRGRPPGIRNPKRRLPDLAARPLRPAALASLIDRKPYLLRPLALRWLPPRAALDPAARIGVDPAAVRRPQDALSALQAVWAAVAAGDLSPREALRVARQVRARLRTLRRLARLVRRISRMAAIAAARGEGADRQTARPRRRGARRYRIIVVPGAEAERGSPEPRKIGLVKNGFRASRLRRRPGMTRRANLLVKPPGCGHCRTPAPSLAGAR
jgi:hypothetical protein